jgi:hypothetical protein
MPEDTISIAFRVSFKVARGRFWHEAWHEASDPNLIAGGRFRDEADMDDGMTSTASAMDERHQI